MFHLAKYDKYYLITTHILAHKRCIFIYIYNYNLISSNAKDEINVPLAVALSVFRDNLFLASNDPTYTDTG